MCRRKKKEKQQKTNPNQKRMEISLEDQLISAINQRSLTLIMKCYLKQVDASAIVDQTNGDNIIHIAIRSKDLPTVKAVLLLFGSIELLEKPNDAGQLPVNLTLSTTTRRCIQLFVNNHRLANLGVKTAILQSPQPQQQVKQQLQIALSAKASSATKTALYPKKRPVCLCLDGGGIRGLVLIRVLMIIERKLGWPIWPYIDWVAGTSTGAILSLALAKGKSLMECHRLYLKLKNCVFMGTRPYNPANLERLLIQSLTTDLMSSILMPKILITAAKSDVAPPQLVLLRNYSLPPGLKNSEMGYFDEPEKIHIWKAARYSSAAPTYFPPMDNIFVDGGVICNNPTLELLTEIFTLKDHFKMDRPRCVISIGTGTPPTHSLTAYRSRIWRMIQRISQTTDFMRNMAQCLVKQITESNGRPVAHSRAFCKAMDVPFFRFSPILTKDVRLNEMDDAIILEMLWDVEISLHQSAASVEELVALLRGIALQ